MLQLKDSDPNKLNKDNNKIDLSNDNLPGSIIDSSQEFKGISPIGTNVIILVDNKYNSIINDIFLD